MLCTAPAWNAGWAVPSWWQKDRAYSPGRSCRRPRQSTTLRPGDGRQELEAVGCRLKAKERRSPSSGLQVGRTGHIVKQRNSILSPAHTALGLEKDPNLGQLGQTHHETGASLCASQLAGTRNLAHHQGLQLLQLLQQSPVMVIIGGREGNQRDKRRCVMALPLLCSAAL